MFPQTSAVDFVPGGSRCYVLFIGLSVCCFVETLVIVFLILTSLWWYVLTENFTEERSLTCSGCVQVSLTFKMINDTKNKTATYYLKRLTWCSHTRVCRGEIKKNPPSRLNRTAYENNNLYKVWESGESHKASHSCSTCTVKQPVVVVQRSSQRCFLRLKSWFKGHFQLLAFKLFQSEKKNSESAYYTYKTQKLGSLATFET